MGGSGLHFEKIALMSDFSANNTLAKTCRLEQKVYEIRASEATSSTPLPQKNVLEPGVP